MLELTLAHVYELLPRMRAQDAEEILDAGRHQTLEAWAKSRVFAPGCAWAVIEGGAVQMVCGVMEGPVRGIGTLWLAGTDRISHVRRAIVRLWRAIVEAGGFRRLECKCYAGNELANDFALMLGLRLEGTLRGYSASGKDLNQYGMVLA